MLSVIRLVILGFLITVWTTVMIAGCNPVGVVNDERTVGEQLDDKTIATEVKYALFHDSISQGLDIEVKTYTGHVYLIGMVDNQSQIDRAMETAMSVRGVRAVTPYLLLKSDLDTIGRAVDDNVIAVKVKAKLVDDPVLKSTQFDVEVMRGHVILFGIVATSRDLRRAVEDALAVDGVRKVKSFIISKLPG